MHEATGHGPYLLITAPPSPFGRKVAVALAEKGLEFEVRLDMPWGEGSCTPEHSPLAQLPILIAPSGPVYDSHYILDWLELSHPAPALVPASLAGALHEKLVQILAERLMEIAQGLVFELRRPSPGKAWIDRQSSKLIGGIAELERLFAERGELPDRLYVGDIATGTTLLCFEFMVEAGFCPDLECLRWRDRHPALAKAVAEMEQRPSFAATPYGPMDVDFASAVG
jgi:glutathione S-transferase